MSFIVIKDGKAYLTEQGKGLKTVKDVKSEMNEEDFEMTLRFIYHAYNPESIFHNYLPKERKGKIIETMFPGHRWDRIEKRKGVTALIRKYKEMTYSFKYKLYLRLLEDIEELMDELSRIPLKKPHTIDIDREETFVCAYCNESNKTKIKVRTKVMIDNSEEKIKTMAILDKLLAREEKLKEAIRKEDIAKKLEKQSQQRIFDN